VIPANASENDEAYVSIARENDGANVSKLLGTVKSMLVTGSEDPSLQLDAYELWRELLHKAAECDLKFHESKGTYDELDEKPQRGVVGSSFPFTKEHVTPLRLVTNCLCLSLSWCLDCKISWSVYAVPQPFFTLTVQDAHGNLAETLSQAFEFYSRTTLLDNVICMNESCKGRLICQKLLPCEPAPKVLTIHLQPSIEGFKGIPLYFQLPSTSAWYMLVSFICHIGKFSNMYHAFAGHYVSYMMRKSRSRSGVGEWYLGNDRIVTKLTKLRIRPDDKPYVCFFELMTRPPKDTDSTKQFQHEPAKQRRQSAYSRKPATRSQTQKVPSNEKEQLRE
jgi:hypothetical protein